MMRRSNGTVAQLVEQGPFKALVLGSSPSRPTNPSIPATSTDSIRINQQAQYDLEVATAKIGKVVKQKIRPRTERELTCRSAAARFGNQPRWFVIL
jgi:hypothetical protein